MFDWNQKYHPRRIALETIATQSNIMYMLNSEQKTRSNWLPLKEIKSRSATKEDRIRALAPYYEFGRIYHVEECHQLDELEYELTHFPKGENDDIIDALATILDIATPPTTKNRDREKKRRTTDKPRSAVTGI
jgi:predicted phage terminase large subunit-like protein